MKYVFTPRDDLRTFCAQIRYRKLVEWEAIGLTGFRHDAWLSDTLRELQLTSNDFDEDLRSLQNGELSPRMRGEWPALPPIDIEAINDDGIIPAEIS